MVNPSKPDKIDHLEPKKKQGLVVVITGDGKGKTTSALGMAVRACGHGLKVSIIQFMKGDLFAGEWEGIKRLAPEVEMIQTGKGFCGIQGNPYPKEEHRANAQEAIKIALEKITSSRWDMVILDELNNALHLGLVDHEQVMSLLKRRPPPMHIVITGRNAHPDVVDIADTVSEVLEVKHAYRKDIEPQPGIDY